VEGGNVLRHVEREGIVRGGMSRENMLGRNMSGSRFCLGADRLSAETLASRLQLLC